MKRRGAVFWVLAAILAWPVCVLLGFAAYGLMKAGLPFWPAVLTVLVVIVIAAGTGLHWPPDR